jgi:hypothetical protein
MWRWLYRFMKRFLAFAVTTLAGAMAFSWAFGYDEEVRAWASQNRPAVALVMVLSAIVYAMYDFLEEPDR